MGNREKREGEDRDCMIIACVRIKVYTVMYYIFVCCADCCAD